MLECGIDSSPEGKRASKKKEQQELKIKRKKESEEKKLEREKENQPKLQEKQAKLKKSAERIRAKATGRKRKCFAFSQSKQEKSCGREDY